MDHFRCNSSDPWPCSIEEVRESETLEDVQEFDEASEEGIDRTWAEIASRSGRSEGGTCVAGQRMMKKLEKKKSHVLLEGYVEAATVDNDDDLKRTKSLTDDHLEELKGCLDLGFGFSYDEIPELCHTLPALELCYSMSQKFLDEKQGHQKLPENSPVEESPPPPPATTSPVANWKISSPGDHPDDVKARLKYWAQAVACTVKLCS